MDFQELVARNRSYRRFDQRKPLSRDTLTELVGLARLVPSASNKQALRYVVCCSPEWNARIFATLAWANYLPEWPGPAEGERPTGYIVVATEQPDWAWVRADLGIAAQTIMLGATARGLGGCMLANIRKRELKELLELPPAMEILLVIALGTPVEKVVLEEVAPEGSIEYYRSAEGVHHVPKRALAELLLRVLD